MNDAKILALLEVPLTFPEISTALGNPNATRLALTLCRLALSKKIMYSMPKGSFVTQWPLYHAHKLPKGFKHPMRPGK